MNQEPKKPRKPSQIAGRKRKGPASKNQPGGVTRAGHLRYTRAPYFYCPGSTSHPQVPSKLPGYLPGFGNLGLLPMAHSAGRKHGSQLLFILAACERAETRRRSSDSDDARPPRSARGLPDPAPAPGKLGWWWRNRARRRHKAPANAEAAAPTPRALSGPQARLRLSRLGPASAGRRALRQ